MAQGNVEKESLVTTPETARLLLWCRECMEECCKLLVERGVEYNAAGTTLEEYFPTWQDAVTMVNVKVMRLKTMVKSSRMSTPDVEKIKDTVLDLINYSVFVFALLDGINTKK